MGCLCPRKTQYVPPILQENRRPLTSPSLTQHHFAIDSQRNKINQPIQRCQNFQKNIILASHNKQYPPQKVFENKDSSELKTGIGIIKSQILVSQIGGSKLERSISILSTEDDIKSLQYSMSSNHSMIQDMVVVSNVFNAQDKLKKIKKRYYSLIDSKLYVKKDPQNQIKIKSISDQLSLFCNYQTIKETIHLTIGIPIQNIKIIRNQPLAYLVENNFPLLINLKLQCIKCNSFKFRSSSSCKLILDFTCKCSSNYFLIQSIKTQPFTFPIWYKGRKILSNNVSYTSGSQFRVVGCNICWRFQNTQFMQCGCLRCSNCKYEHSNTHCILCL